MKYLILFVLPLLIMSADYETQKYDVVLKENNFEIRYYPPAIKAKVLSENGSNKNFMKLFKYISGNNSNNEKIAMTTPVYLSNENETNAIIVASYGTFSTGINIRNIHNIVFSSPSKSKIRVLQSIGRGLRKTDTKSTIRLYDVADNLNNTDTKINFSLRHFYERLKIYKSQQFNYKVNRIKL